MDSSKDWIILAMFFGVKFIENMQPILTEWLINFIDVFFFLFIDYAAKKEILKCLTIPNEEKEAHTLPVEQTSRDRGYMYFIRPVFLPLLRNLDEKIRCEFGEGKHGEDLVTVIDSKINTDKDLLDELIETVRSSAELCGIEPDERVSKFLCQTFIRKYTHARIGGFIRGEYDAHVEAMGGEE